MKYQVLARKYRPKNFSTIIGQEHVLKALGNALQSQRLHHAYLFTGTRGVGKTTVARVLAKALNCEQGISATPCGECSACLEIDQGRFVDLIEVDAASRTKVEDTRELLDNVQYAPTRGRFKIYLIDEVHMLSGHSFNALLKTLEEPPPHVKFLLATTDPQKLPVTILSRCLQFNLKRLTIEQIEQHLEQILNAENIPFEANILKPLAIAADGSVRDALSLLDQAISYCDSHPNLADIEMMLGSVQKDRIFELLKALANAEGRLLIEQSRILAGQGIDVNTILAELITTLQRIALCQMVPEAIDDSLGDKESIAQLAETILAEDIQLYYQIALNGRKDLPYSPQPQGGFEMILLRMLAFKPTTSETNRSLESPKKQQVSTSTQSSKGDSSHKISSKTQEHLIPQETQAVAARQPDEIATNRHKPLAIAPESEHQPQNINSIPDDFDLPPLEVYGQENFIEIPEQEISQVETYNPPLEELQPKQPQPRKEPQPRNKEPQHKNNKEYQATQPRQNQPQSNVLQLQTTEQQQTRAQTEQTTQAKPIEKKPEIAIPCNKKDGSELADYWHDLINRTKVSGLEQQLAKHCALVNKTEQKGEQVFELLLESVYKHLCSDKIKKRLLDALQDIMGPSLKLDIKECRVKPEDQLHTPRRREIHEAEVLQQQAVESIFTDPKVKMLVDAFAATVRQESIKPV